MNLNNLKPVFAKGYDLIEFYNRKTVKGKKEFCYKFENVDFYFSSATNRHKFLTDPKRYMPEYGGFCAIAMSENHLLNPNPVSYILENQKLYFFSRMFFGIIDAKRQWVKSADEKRKLADSHWSKFS